MLSAETVSKKHIISLIRSLKGLRLAVQKDLEDCPKDSPSFQYRKGLAAGLEEAENRIYMILSDSE